MASNRDIKNLDTLMDGAVVERFNAELRKVLENIYDMRTDPIKKRKIVLEFAFTPSANRDAATMTYNVKTTLVPPKEIEQTVLMRQRDDGSVVVTERTDQIPGQIDMTGNEQPLPRVIEFASDKNS